MRHLWGLGILIFLPGLYSTVNSKLVTRQGESFLEPPSLEDVSKFGVTVWGGLKYLIDGAENARDALLNPILPASEPESAGPREQTTPQSIETYPVHLSTDQCDPKSQPNSEGCETTANYVIFPVNCQDDRNEQVSALLNEWVTPQGYWISHDSQCSGSKVLFWRATRLTDKQVGKLREMIDIVSAVEPDGTAELFDSVPSGKSKSESKSRSKSKRRISEAKRQLEKRDLITIQQFASTDLGYVSNPLGSKADSLTDHYYITNAGQGITVYVIDLGFEPSVNELRSSPVVRKLFAGHRLRELNDKDGHGTCVASKITGLHCGPVKKVALIDVKMEFSMQWSDNHQTLVPQIAHSVIVDAFQAVINDLMRRSNLGEEVKGFTIVNICTGAHNVNMKIYQTFEAKIKTLVQTFEVVIVAAAGNNGLSNPIIDHLPAALSPEFPIIVVGSVSTKTDQMDWYTQRGVALTTFAPGDVTCVKINGRFGPRTGTSFAAPAVTGVIAGFMTGKRGQIIRESGQSMPEAMKRYVIQKSTEREQLGGGFSIWNGINPGAGPPQYGWTDM